jgi:predicted tellurium resistance membrane protein TerC
MSNPTPDNKQPSTDSVLPILAIVLAFLIPIAGAVIGLIALRQMSEGRLADTNKGLAKAGMILGFVFTGLLVAFYVVGIALAIWWASSGYDPYP